MNEFSQILKKLRISANLSQETLGNVLHVSRSAIAKYENGLGLPSEEVIDSICKYFNVTKEDLFPKDNVEQLITDKNIKIKKQRNRLITISILLVSVIVILFGVIGYNSLPKFKEVYSLDESMGLDIDKPNEYQQDILLFKYEGGYVFQRLEIHKIKFTSETNLYVLRVMNSYTNGYASCINDNEGFLETEFTEKVYMDINFTHNLNNFRPIVSWHQKKSTSFLFSSQYVSNDEIILDERKNLFDGAYLERKDKSVKFIYNSQITDYLFDSNYNKLLRKTNIVNDSFYSSFEYEMVDDYSRFVTFTIYASYLFEAKEGNEINFEVNTKMVNTNMSIKKKKVFKLSL